MRHRLKSGMRGSSWSSEDGDKADKGDSGYSVYSEGRHGEKKKESRLRKGFDETEDLEMVVRRGAVGQVW